MPTIRFKLRYDTAANWTALNPVLAAGEPGVEVSGTARRVKYGDGSTAWNDLSYGVGGPVAWTDITGKPTTLAGYGLTINNSDWFGADLSITNGGTGASTAPVARANLGAAASGANTDITSLSNVTIAGGSATGLTEVAATVVRTNGAATKGNVRLETPGDTSTPGYIGIYIGTTRVGYVGYRSGAGSNRLTLTAEGAFLGWLITGVLTLPNATTYATDAAAGAAGLVAGDVYKTSDGAGGFNLKIKA